MATLKDLDKAISDQTFESVYVFYGVETGLISEYVTEMKGHFKNVIESNDLSVVIEDSKYNGLFGGRKLYILRRTGLFGKKADEEFIQFLVKMFKQKSSVVLFVEDKVDKTLKQTQALSSNMAVEFTQLKEDQLIMLVQKIMEQNNKKIIKDLARYLVDQCDYDYSKILNETEKLVHFATEKSITVEHIREITTRSTGAVVFDMVTFVVKQNYIRALDQYENLLLRKESALVILTLIYRQLKLLYQIKLLKAENTSITDMADACDSKNFIIEKNLNICSFDTKKILSLMQKCDELDFKIKSGAIKENLAVKVLILYSSLK